jgi:predicted RNA-binding protein with PUA domain
VTPQAAFYEATGAALDLITEARHYNRLKLEGAERMLWQARESIDVALAAREHAARAEAAE